VSPSSIPGRRGDDAPAVSPGDVVMRMIRSYFPPAEVETLLGSPAKAIGKLGVEPSHRAQQIVPPRWVANDLKVARWRIERC